MSSPFREEWVFHDEAAPRSPESASPGHIVVRLVPAIAASLRRVLGGDDPEYEDMLQTTLERVLRTLRQRNFRGDCTVAGWAYVIARNVAVDALRARTRERRFVSLDEGSDDSLPQASGEAGPERLAAARQQLHRYKKTLAGMRLSTATVVYLHDVVGHDLSEIAGRLRISAAAAQSRLVRGRRDVAAAMAWNRSIEFRGRDIGPGGDAMKDCGLDAIF